MTCGIYMLLAPNGKRYIGHSKNIEARWKEHEKDLKSRKHRSKELIAAYHEYGSVEKIILLICPAEELLIHEQYFLDELKPECNTLKTATRVETTPEARINLSAATKRQWQDPEYIKMQKEAQSIRSLKMWQDPIYIKKQTDRSLAEGRDPVRCKMQSIKAKERWENSSKWKDRIFSIILENPRWKNTKCHSAFEIILMNPGITRREYYILGGSSGHLRSDVKCGYARIVKFES